MLYQLEQKGPDNMKKTRWIVIVLLFVMSIVACTPQNGEESSAVPAVVSHTGSMDSTADNDQDTVVSSFISESQALTMLQSFSLEELGLPSPLDSYHIVFDPEPAMIEGRNCYVISAYVDPTNYAENASVFYVALDGSVVFKIDPNSGNPITIS